MTSSPASTWPPTPAPAYRSQCASEVKLSSACATARHTSLAWGHLDNRPFLRALHGMALALWQLDRFEEAEQALLNMQWLNPADNQGARELLAAVRVRAGWQDTAQ